MCNAEGERGNVRGRRRLSKAKGLREAERKVDHNRGGFAGGEWVRVRQKRKKGAS